MPAAAQPRELPDGVVLARWNLVYVPVPKAACTSTLSVLAKLLEPVPAPTPALGSAAVTRALMVHEPAFWAQASSSRAMTLGDWRTLRAREDWLIFTVVRHPVRRLWSAWHSKLLLREPRFVAAFGSQPWFPRIPHGADEVAQDFRCFVHALGEDPDLLTADRHWQPQADHLQPDRVDFTHVGRTEAYADTLAVLNAHLRGRGSTALAAPRHDNATLIRPEDVAAIDAATCRAIEALYSADMAAFGYAPAAANGARPTAEQRLIDQLLCGVREIIARHERIGDLLAQAGADR